MGGRGQGEGGVAPETEGGDEQFSPTRLSGKFDARGRVIAFRYFRGLPEKGEAVEEYRQVFRAYDEAARDSLNREEIPLGYRECVRKYFESVRPKENE